MAYTAPSPATFAREKGTLSEKLTRELGEIQAEIEEHRSKFVTLSPVGTQTALATSGVDLASGSDATYYGSWVVPDNITVVAMHDYLTEAYVKDTADAKITVKDDADTPNTIFTRTLTAAGEDAGEYTSTNPATGKENIDAGTRLDLAITATGSSSGTGHAVVVIEYYER